MDNKENDIIDKILNILANNVEWNAAIGSYINNNAMKEIKKLKDKENNINENK